MFNTNQMNKGLSEFKNFVITVILIIFTMIIIPFTPLFLMPLGLLIGEPKAYIIQNILYNSYVPLSLILIFMLSKIFFRFLQLGNKVSVGFPSIVFIKESLKPGIIFLMLLVGIISFSITTLRNITNLLLDIPSAINCEYAQTDGVLKFIPSGRADDDIDIAVINGLRFDGGYAFYYRDKLLEGKSYHVEYLPHSKHIVKATQISQ